MANIKFYNDSFKTITVLKEDTNIPPLFWSMMATSAVRVGNYEPPAPPITPYEGFKFQTSLAAGLRPAGDFPLMRAKDVVMPDGTRLHDFNPLPPAGEEGMVLKVENGKWAAGWTIRAERDDEDSATLNIF